MSTSTPAPVIRVVKKKHAHAAHHGSSWKVAYADFVTAMMAFFLLMWLLNATSDDQRRGLADYFAPSNALGRSATAAPARPSRVISSLAGVVLRGCGSTGLPVATERSSRPGCGRSRTTNSVCGLWVSTMAPRSCSAIA